MPEERRMAAHVAAAVGRTAGAAPAQARITGGRVPVAPVPIPKVRWPALPIATHGATVQAAAKKQKQQEKDRRDATQVLSDFQVYGLQQYKQLEKQLIRAADCTDKVAINMMVNWIMVHPTWGAKKNLGHQSQKPGAPMHPDTKKEVDELATDMEKWINKKYP